VGGYTSDGDTDASTPVSGGGQQVRRGWVGGQAGVGLGAPPELAEGRPGCHGH
jgi:hypothetical protein